MNFQMSKEMAAVYCVALICGSVLIGIKVVSPEVVMAALGMWLAPAPFQFGGKKEP